MYNIQWRSSTAQKGRRSNSTQTTPRVTVRNSIYNVIPSGTVASRVRFLENHPTANSTLRRRPTPTCVRLQSRIGLRHRLTSRFGKPASQNEHLDEESRVDIVHGYLGVNRIRSWHKSGITDGGSDRRSTYSRANGIHAQLQPQGLTQRVQYDALSPWTFDPKYSRGPSKMGQCGQRIDPLMEVDGIGSKSFFTGRSLFPTLTAGISHSDIHRRDLKPRQDATMKSDISALTTSTVRRQSVRDLFADYGIERPPGLVFDKPGPPEEADARQVKSKIRCLNCFWYNSGSSNWCIKCRFPLRTVRQKNSYQTLVSPKGEEYYLEKVPDEESPSSSESSGKENLPASPNAQNQHSKPGLGPSQMPKHALLQAKKPSTPTTKFPSFNMATSPPKSSTSSLKVMLPQLPVAPQLLSGSRTTSIVKDSPFLIADRLSSGRSSNTLPATPLMDGIYCRKPRSKLSKLYLILSGGAAECESVACRATHEDHEPYRHSVSCSRMKKRVHGETDNGYMADTSFAESEYIECRGYPRTGHDRHGSANSGALGQCQHCIDDCQCTACQKTHHSVRCCMNENHQGIIHHHHTPKEVTASINPLDCPTLSSQDAKAIEKISRTASIVVPSASWRKVSLPPTPNASQIRVNIQPPSRKPTKKPQTLPRSKRSTLFKQKLKAPTQPPWATDSKVRTKSPATTAISSLQIQRTTVDTALGVHDKPDPPPPFKERPTLMPPATCDRSSPEGAGTEARKLSKTSSDLFRFGEKNTIPLLSQKLLEHQQELRSIGKACDERLKFLSEESEKFSQGRQPSDKTTGKGEQKADAERKTGEVSITKKGKWQLSPVDRKPLPPCCNDEPVGEHNLSEDETVRLLPEKAPVREHTLSEDVIVDEGGREVVPAKEVHDCVWRNRFLDRNGKRSRKGGESELQGVTVVLRMEGKDDLVIEADLRKGGEVRASGY